MRCHRPNRTVHVDWCDVNRGLAEIRGHVLVTYSLISAGSMQQEDMDTTLVDCIKLTNDESRGDFIPKRWKTGGFPTAPWMDSVQRYLYRATCFGSKPPRAAEAQTLSLMVRLLEAVH